MAQGTNRLNPLADIVFSCIFQDMEGAPAMKELINAVLANAGDEPIAEIIEMRSQYPQMAQRPGGKSGRLDVKAKTAGGELVNMEVQLGFQEYFVDRELFYGTKMMVEEVKDGQTYHDIPRTKVIAFIDFILSEDSPDIVQPVKFMYTKKPARAASDKICIYNVELPKFTAEYGSIEDVSGEAGKGGSLLEWLYMLTRGYQSEEEMGMLEERTAGLSNFTDLYKKANADQKLRDMYEYQLSAKLDENSRIRAAEERGERRGEERGQRRGEERGEQRGQEMQAKKTARNLYAMGLGIEQIAQGVDSTADTVREWLGLTADTP